MHDEVLTLFDDCVCALIRLRGNLAANRRVEPGERHDAVLRAVAAAEHFATEARRAINPPGIVDLGTRDPQSDPILTGSASSLPASSC
jgi:hypothetical protein